MAFPFKLIDLTHALCESVPTWNGGCGFEHNLHIDYADCPGIDKFRVMKVKMHAGIGTHMDSPSHCISGGMCIDDFDVNQLVFPCIVIDIAAQCHSRLSLTPSDITHFESQYGRIPSGSCVMIKTGWSQYWHSPTQYHNHHLFPSVSIEAALIFLERGVCAIGIDTLSPDRPEDGFPVHQAFLGAGKIILENVANLDAMPPTGSFVLALPLKIQEGTEAPVRLVGLIS